MLASRKQGSNCTKRVSTWVNVVVCIYDQPSTGSVTQAEDASVWSDGIRCDYRVSKEDITYLHSITDV